MKRQDKLVLAHDFNVGLATDTEVWSGILGSHGTGNMNSNDLRLFLLCSKFGLTITNTKFQMKNIYKSA